MEQLEEVPTDGNSVSKYTEQQSKGLKRRKRLPLHSTAQAELPHPRGCISAEYFEERKRYKRAVLEAQKGLEVLISLIGDRGEIGQINIDYLQGIPV